MRPTDRAAGASAVLDDHVDTHLGRHPLGEQAGQHIHSAASREGNDDANRPAGKLVLRLSRRGVCENRECG